MIKRFFGMLAGIGLVAALAVALSGSAHNGDGTPIAFGHSTGSAVQNADGSKDVTVNTVSPKTVDLTGKTQRVATGTTTKFHVVGGVGVWNMKMWWDDLGAGSSYKTTQVSLWNPGNAYSSIRWTVRYGDGTPTLTDIANSGQTVFEYADHTSGGPTTKADSDQATASGGGSVIDPSGCVYLIPTGGSDSGTDCSI